MKEYIEREAFIKKVKDIPMWGSMAAMMADSLPAADVVERKRGEWIDGADQFGAKRGEFRVCSFCNTCFPRDDRIVPPSMWQCCPNCFTDMRSHHDSLCDQEEEVDA